MLPLGFVFDILDAEKDEGKQQSQHQMQDKAAALAELGAAHGPGHRQAAGQQDDGVERAQLFIQMDMGMDKHIGMVGAINSVGAEQPAEKEHFGGQKKPHAQFAGLELLLRRAEMVRQMRIVGVSQNSILPSAANAGQDSPACPAN